MTEKIVIHRKKEDSNIILVFGFCSIVILFIVMSTMVANGTCALSLAIVTNVLCGCAWISFGMESFFRFLQLGTEYCVYQNMFGKRRNFTIRDVCSVQCKEYMGLSECIFLYDKDRKVLAKIEKDLKNAEKLIPFFQEQKETGNWNGVILKEFESEKVEKHLKKYESEYIEKALNESGTEKNLHELVVKPNKMCFLESILGIAFCAFMGGFLIYEIVDFILGNIDALFLVIMVAIVVVPAMAITIVLWKKALSRYKNQRLLMSTKNCSMADEKGNTTTFLFDEIEDVNIIYEGGKSRIPYLYVKLRDGRKVGRIIYDYRMENVKKVQSFVLFHKRNKESKSSGIW